MTSAHITIFGGQADQLQQLVQMIPSSCLINLNPLDQHGSEEPLSALPAIVLILPGDAHETATDLLKKIRESLPDTPILFLAENPEREDIIRAFRMGVTDYLLFPLCAEVCSPLFEDLIEQSTQSPPSRLFKNLKDKLGQWIKKPETTKLTNFLKSSLWILPYDFSSIREGTEKKTHELEVQLLGPLKINIRGKLLPILPGEKTNALLAYFLYHHQKPVHREKLLAKFWGYTDPASARNSLNVATHNIRRYIQESFPDLDFLQYENNAYQLNPELDVFIDTDQFLLNWKRGRSIELNEGLEKAFPHYQKAAYFYQGDFLENIHYEEWCDNERSNLKEKYLMILDRLAAHFFQQGNFRVSASIFQKMLLKDNCMEAVHRNLILSYYQLGQRDNAIKQYYRCAEALQKELGIRPSQTTQELFQLIRAEKSIPSYVL